MSFRLSRKSNKNNTFGRSWFRSPPKNDVSAAVPVDCTPSPGAGDGVLPGQANDTQHPPSSKDPVNTVESITASVVNNEGMAEGSLPATPTDRSPVKDSSSGAKLSYDASGDGCTLASIERPLKRQPVNSLGKSLRSRALFLHISPTKSISGAFRGLGRFRKSNVADSATFEPPETCSPDGRQDMTPRTTEPFPKIHPSPSDVSNDTVLLPSIPTPSQAQHNAGAWYLQCSPDGVDQNLKKVESRKMTLRAKSFSSEKQRLSAIAGAEETWPGQKGAKLQEHALNKICQITLTAVAGLPDSHVAEDDATEKLEFSDDKVDELSLSSSDETPQPTPRPLKLKQTVALVQETSGLEEGPNSASSSLVALVRRPSLSRSINLHRGPSNLSESKVENTSFAPSPIIPIEGCRMPSHCYEADQEDNSSSSQKNAVAKVPSSKKNRFRKRSMIAWILEPPPPNETLRRGPLTGYQTIVGLDPSPEGTVLLRTSSPERPSLESPLSSIEKSNIQQPTIAFNVTLPDQSHHNVFGDLMKPVEGESLMNELDSLPASSTSATTVTTEVPNLNNRLWSKLGPTRLKEMESSVSLRRRYMVGNLTPPQTPHDSSDSDSFMPCVFRDRLSVLNANFAGNGTTNMTMTTTTATGMVNGRNNGSGTAQRLAIGGSLESTYSGAPDSLPTSIDPTNIPARLSFTGKDISIEKSRARTDTGELPSISDLPLPSGGHHHQQQRQQQLDGQNHSRSVDGDQNVESGIYVNIDELEQFLIGGPLKHSFEHSPTTTTTTATTTATTAAAIFSLVDIDSHADGGSGRVGDDNEDVKDDDDNDDGDDDDDDDQSTTYSRRHGHHPSSSVGEEVWSATGSGYETDDESLVGPDE